MAAVGEAAPDFTLKDQNNQPVSLSGFRGARDVVLVFFPLAFTGICTAEMCSVSEGLAEYANLNAAVYAISVDSPFAQEAWAKANNIGITLVSDLNKEVTNAYGVLFKGLAGIGDSSARAAFVIDAAGNVVYSEQTATPKDLPNFDAIKAKVAGK